MHGVIKTQLLGSNELLCGGLKHMLSGTYFNIRDMISPYDRSSRAQPDLVIFVFAGDLGELEAFLLASRDETDLPKLVVVMFKGDDDAYASVLRLNPDGCLPATIGRDMLIRSLEVIVAGGSVIVSSAPLKVLPHDIRQQHECSDGLQKNRSSAEINLPSLSRREKTILGALAEGDSNKAIARRLSIRETTVKVHVKAVLRKIGVSNRTQAAVWALNQTAGQLPHLQMLQPPAHASDRHRGSPMPTERLEPVEPSDAPLADAGQGSLFIEDARGQDVIGLVRSCSSMGRTKSSKTASLDAKPAAM